MTGPMIKMVYIDTFMKRIWGAWNVLIGKVPVLPTEIDWKQFYKVEEQSNEFSKTNVYRD